MKKAWFILLFGIINTNSNAQNFYLGIFAGASGYGGDLNKSVFSKKSTNGAIGVSVNYELNPNIIIRSGLNYSKVGGYDKYSSDASIRPRNLSFETKIIEGNLLLEYDVLNLNENKISPYVFAGIAVFHFNPYTDYLNQKIYLHKLNTEGQGLPGYAKPYSLTQLAIPIGGGLKIAINDYLRVGIEFGNRKLFTDYLDDVSGAYPDATALLSAYGTSSVKLSYRGDELPGGNTLFPAKGSQRGNPKRKDYYYFAGIHLTYRFNTTGLFSNFGNYRSSRSKNGCPSARL